MILFTVRHATDMNSRALNIVYVNMWKKVNVGILRPVDNVVSPTSTCVRTGFCINRNGSYTTLLSVFFNWGPIYKRS